jgi:hypothetical protein
MASIVGNRLSDVRARMPWTASHTSAHAIERHLHARTWTRTRSRTRSRDNSLADEVASARQVMGRIVRGLPRPGGRSVRLRRRTRSRSRVVRGQKSRLMRWPASARQHHALSLGLRPASSHARPSGVCITAWVAASCGAALPCGAGPSVGGDNGRCSCLYRQASSWFVGRSTLEPTKRGGGAVFVLRGEGRDVSGAGEISV